MKWTAKEWLMFGGAFLVVYLLSKSADASGLTVAGMIAEQEKGMGQTQEEMLAAQDIAFSDDLEAFDFGPFAGEMGPDYDLIQMRLA
jgi:hypothetical protein